MDLLVSADASGSSVTIDSQDGGTVTIGPGAAGAMPLTVDCAALQRDTERQVVVWAGPNGQPTLAAPTSPSRRFLAVVILPARQYGPPPTPNAPPVALALQMEAVRVVTYALPSP